MAKKSRLDVYYQMLEAKLGQDKVEEAKRLQKKLKAHGKKVDIFKALTQLGHIDKQQIQELKEKFRILKEDENIATVPETESPEEIDSIFTDPTIQPRTLKDEIEEVVPETRKGEVTSTLAYNRSDKAVPITRPQDTNKSKPAKKTGRRSTARFDEEKYERVKTIGQGGMGVVELYKDTNMDDMLVAVKKILAEKVTKSQEERFVKEQQAGIKLAGISQICRALDKGHDSQGNLRLVTEFVNGQEYKEILDEVNEKNRTRKYPLSLLLGYISEMAKGMHKAHEKGILHRDLKPPNVMITEEGEVKIMDFGLAKIRGEKELSRKLKIKGKKGKQKIQNLENAVVEEDRLTMDNVAMGTPPYMPREQVLDAAKADNRADIYSLGAMLYETLTGFPPHDWARNKDDSINLQKTLLNILNEEITPPSEIEDKPYGDNIDADIEAIAMKALSDDPKKRYKTMLEFSQDIDRYLARKPVLARPRGIFEKIGNFVRDRPLITGLAAVILLGGSVATVSIQHLDSKAQKAAKEKAQATSKLEKKRADDETRKRKDAEKKNLELIAESYLYKAFTLSNSKKWEEAVEEYTEAIKLAPRNYRARGNRSLAYFNIAQTEQDDSRKKEYYILANQDIEIAIEEKPTLSSPRRMHAKIQWQLGNLDDAEKIFKKAISLDDKNIDLLADTSTFYQERKNWNAVITLCHKMLDINEEYKQAHVGLLNAYYELKDMDKTEKEARFLINSRQLPDAWLFLSRILYERAAAAKDDGEARIAFLQEAKERIDIAIQICSKDTLKECKKYQDYIDKAYEHFIGKND